MVLRGLKPSRHYSTKSQICRHKAGWMARIHAVHAKFWFNHLHVAAQIEIHQARLCFSDAQPSSFNNPASTLASEVCSEMLFPLTTMTAAFLSPQTNLSILLWPWHQHHLKKCCPVDFSLFCFRDCCVRKSKKISSFWNTTHPPT